jgi:hypothetical protein
MQKMRNLFIKRPKQAAVATATKAEKPARKKKDQPAKAKEQKPKKVKVQQPSVLPKTAHEERRDAALSRALARKKKREGG